MTLQELHDFLYGQNTAVNAQLLMDHFEANLDLITKADLTNLTEYDYVLRLTCDYAMALENSGYFLKSILFLEDAIHLIEQYPGYQKDQLFDTQFYEKVLFHKARAFYHLRNYQNSQSIFARLQKAFPESEKYRSWIFMIQVKRYENWIWVGLAMMLVTLIVKTVLDGQYPVWDQISYWILVLSLLGTAVLLIIKNKDLRQVKKLDAL